MVIKFEKPGDPSAGFFIHLKILDGFYNFYKNRKYRASLTTRSAATRVISKLCYTAKDADSNVVLATLRYAFCSLMVAEKIALNASAFVRKDRSS